MSLKATITLNKTQLCECICSYLQTKGVHNVSHQDIEFEIRETTRGTQRDLEYVYDIIEVKIKNVEVGN